MPTKPTNVSELCKQLLKAPADRGELMARCARRILNTYRLQLEYSLLRGERPSISFLDVDYKVPVSAKFRRFFAEAKSLLARYRALTAWSREGN